MKKTMLTIKGMHCASCEVLIKDKFKEDKNIKEIKPDFRKSEVEITYSGQLNKDRLNGFIKPFGYTIAEKQEIISEPILARLIDAGTIGIFIFILYFLAQQFNLIPDFNTGSSLSLVAVFIMGLVASTSTCMATSGALFLATIGKLTSKNKLTSNTQPATSNIFPALSFNAGRIISYGFFGMLLGFFGKTVSYNIQAGTFLTLIVSVLMILIGLDMAKLISFSSLMPASLTSSIFEKLEKKLMLNPKKTSFLLGAITYFLPCGFTQTVQLYALGLADPIQSALLMTVFALGTMPVLMAIGFTSNFTKFSFYPYLQKAMGVLVLMIGISYLGNFMSLAGFNLQLPASTNKTVNDVNVIMKNGIQEVKMTVNSRGYSPNNFTIKKNVPVKWIINGENVFGCQGYFVVPKLGFQKALNPGENLIEFTAKDDEPILFSCGMGMYKGRFEVSN